MTKKYISIILYLSFFLSAPAFAFESSAILKEINNALMTYSSHWPDGMCATKSNYKLGAGNTPDSLAIAFATPTEPISLTIHGVEINKYDRTTPGLRLDSDWIENGRDRVNYRYITYTDSLANLSGQPSAVGKYRLDIYFALYRDVKKFVQIGIWIKDMTNGATVFWADLAQAQNCKI